LDEPTEGEDDNGGTGSKGMGIKILDGTPLLGLSRTSNDSYSDPIAITFFSLILSTYSSHHAMDFYGKATLLSLMDTEKLKPPQSPLHLHLRNHREISKQDLQFSPPRPSV